VTARCPMKVGDLVKSLNGMSHYGNKTGATMRGMLIRRTLTDFREESPCQIPTDWLVHWFVDPPDELTFEYSEDLEVISASR